MQFIDSRKPIPADWNEEHFKIVKHIDFIQFIFNFRSSHCGFAITFVNNYSLFLRRKKLLRYITWLKLVSMRFYCKRNSSSFFQQHSIGANYRQEKWMKKWSLKKREITTSHLLDSSLHPLILFCCDNILQTLQK